MNQKTRNIYLYSSSSFGGCYDYALRLADAMAQSPNLGELHVLFPTNAPTLNKPWAKRVLIADQVQGTLFKRKLWFLWRNLLAPLQLLAYLKGAKSGLVIFNDFEQLTAPIWAPLLQLFAGKHTYAIILHDPDRDAYPPSLAYTQWCMRRMMSIMSYAGYHDFLPEKPYYRPNGITKYLSVPHGLYEVSTSDEATRQTIKEQVSEGMVLFSILGNIRKEKNYELAIQAIAHHPEAMLLIAGAPSNSSVNVEEYKELAAGVSVTERIIWLEKFLTDEELSATIEASDVVVLNYARSFTSQSGILNMAAPFKKQLIVSDGDSSLAKIVERFELGEMTLPDSLDSLTSAMGRVIAQRKTGAEHHEKWDAYLTYADWHKNAAIWLSV